MTNHKRSRLRLCEVNAPSQTRRSVISIVLCSWLASMPAAICASGDGIRTAARAEATRLAQQAVQRDTRMAPGYLWTGAGLLIGGGGSLLLAAAIDRDTCTRDDGLSKVDCINLRPGLAVLGAAAAGAGLVVLAVGRHHREPVTVSITPARVAVRAAIVF
jgi:hypothetical protein